MELPKARDRTEKHDSVITLAEELLLSLKKRLSLITAIKGASVCRTFMFSLLSSVGPAPV